MPASQKHTKPLFHEKTLARAMAGFAWPDNMGKLHDLIKPWIATYKRGTLDAVKETSLHGDFLRDVFGQVLGYTSVVQGEGEAWTLHAEQSISDHGGSADGAVGRFSTTETLRGKTKLVGRVVAPIELKGAKVNLDRRPAKGSESPVEQGWRYANYTVGCQWVIVSNYRETRLYHTGKTPAYYELFWLEDLEDLAEFKKLYFLLCAANFLPPDDQPDSRSALDRLLKESDKAEKEITKELYAEYQKTRFILVNHMREQGPAGADQDTIVEKAQKLLDRVLFIAFCEDRGLLPARSIKQAHDTDNPYAPSSIWTRFRALFRWVDQGEDDPPIPGYNGGLFRLDPYLDEQLELPDNICHELARLARYDFDTDVSVDVLGHIFEQSITDLEELKAALAGEEFDRNQGKRKKTGVFYTPPLITQYIVDLALGGYLRGKEAELRQAMDVDAIPEHHTKKRGQAELEIYRAYRDQVLAHTRVLDPACGSGAFLIAAYDFLLAEYQRVRDLMATIERDLNRQRGEPWDLFSLNKTILDQNLFGVDLSRESVDITKLSLWLKTAEAGRKLTYLDDNIRQGNSIVADPALDPLAFDWQAAFPEVFADGGFDVVLGNPPYVRQEELSPLKPYLQEHYAAYDGVADLYVYFYERGVGLLKPGGMLSYVVTNKWLRSGYGQNLRGFFAQQAEFQQIVDFGHAKTIFPDADVFPCVIALSKPEAPGQPQAGEVQVCQVPRERLADINLTQYVSQHGYGVSRSRYGDEPWSLEHPDVDRLMQKIRERGVPLADFAGVKPYRGVVTGLNAAFLIDTATKQKLVHKDPRSEEIIKPYMRGQDIKRWVPQWAGLWMIFARRGINIDDYPAIKDHLLQFRERLEPRPTDWDTEEDGKWPGRKSGNYEWYEIQDAIDYYSLFDESKIFYQEIQFHPSYSYESGSFVANNKVFLLPTDDLYLLGALCSPLIWWHNWRYLPHMKDEALSPSGYLMESLPIAHPAQTLRERVVSTVRSLLNLRENDMDASSLMLDWLYHEHDIDKPGNKLAAFESLSQDAFIAEVKKRRPKASGGLSPAQVAGLKEAYGDHALPMQARQAEAAKLERLVSDLVNQAYGLTPDEIDLMWKTAPPRMPFMPE